MFEMLFSIKEILDIFKHQLFSMKFKTGNWNVVP